MHSYTHYSKEQTIKYYKKIQKKNLFLKNQKI